MSCWSTPGTATKRPSPCDTGIWCSSPGWVYISQGERLSEIFVVTYWETWRPILLKVKVGLSAVKFNNVAIRQQTKLDQGLEAIADPKCQAIADEEQLADLVGNLGVSQSGSYEFTRAFRFVAAGKAAGQHQDLGPGDALCHRLQGLGNVVCGPVSDDEDLDLSTGVEEDFLGVVIRSWCLGKQG